MIAPVQPATKPPGISFADSMPYDDLFAEYKATYGSDVPDNVKTLFRKKADSNLRTRDGGTMFGNGFGLFELIPYLLGSSIQTAWKGDWSSLGNIWTAVTTGFKTGKWDDLSTAVGAATSDAGSAISGTAAKGTLWQLQQASARTCADLMAAGVDPKMACALTGTQLYSDNSSSPILQNDMLRGVARRQAMTLPVDTDTSLNNPKPYDVQGDAVPTSGLPPKTYTQPLTARGQ